MSTHHRHIARHHFNFFIKKRKFNQINEDISTHFVAVEQTVPTCGFVIHWDICSVENEVAPTVENRKTRDVLHPIWVCINGQCFIDAVTVGRKSRWHKDKRLVNRSNQPLGFALATASTFDGQIITYGIGQHHFGIRIRRTTQDNRRQPKKRVRGVTPQYRH